MIYVEETLPERFIKCPKCNYCKIEKLKGGGGGRIPDVYWYQIIPFNEHGEVQCPECKEWIESFQTVLKKSVYLVERKGFIFKKEKRILLKTIEVEHENRRRGD